MGKRDGGWIFSKLKLTENTNDLHYYCSERDGANKTVSRRTIDDEAKLSTSTVHMSWNTVAYLGPSYWATRQIFYFIYFLRIIFVFEHLTTKTRNIY